MALLLVEYDTDTGDYSARLTAPTPPGSVALLNADQTFTGENTFSNAVGILTSDANGPQIINEASSATNPTLLPDRADGDTGIGGVGGSYVSTIVNGAERLRVAAGGIGIGTTVSATQFASFDHSFGDITNTSNYGIVSNTKGKQTGGSGSGTLHGGHFGARIITGSDGAWSGAPALVALALQVFTDSGSSSTVAESNGLNVIAPAINGATITNVYGIVIRAQTGGSTASYGMAIEDATTAGLWLSSNAQSTNAAGGILFGSGKDTNLFRGAADTLSTDSNFSIPATEQYLMDGPGGHTYWAETSGDVVSLFVGGQEMFKVHESAATANHNVFVFDAPNQVNLNSASGSTYHLVLHEGLALDWTKVADPITVTDGLSLFLGSITLKANAAMVITTASTLYVATPNVSSNMTVTNNYPINTQSGAFLTSAGVWTDNPSTRTKKENEAPLSFEDARRMFAEIGPTQWNYKREWNDKGRLRAGIIAEDLPEWLVPLGSTQRDVVQGSVMAGAALAGVSLLFDRMSFVEDQYNARFLTVDTRLEKLEAENKSLKERLEDLEAA
jgi:hypothetical protein